jgi:regulator of sirC expression with transglutaminase-like and TPR domain
MQPNEVLALISLISDDDREVVSHVETKILELGTPIIPLLEQEWEKSLDPDVQQRIEQLIHALQQKLVQERLIVWKQNGGKDLLEGLWIIATYQYPDLALETVRMQIEQIYYEAWLQLDNDLHPFDQIKALNGVIFTKMKFSANTVNFHSPANSMINLVLESKKGNPITLCAIYMLVAQKLKMPVYGVNLPNLFVLTYKQPYAQFYINAFSRGIILSKADIDNYLAKLNLAKLPMFYEPCNHIDIIFRVLRNLVVSFERNNETEKVEEIKSLLQILTDTPETSV